MALTDDILGKWHFRTPSESEFFEKDMDVTLIFPADGSILMEVEQPVEGQPTQHSFRATYDLDDSFTPARYRMYNFEFPPGFMREPMPTSAFPVAIIEMPDWDTLRICGASQRTPEVYPQTFGQDTAGFKRVR